MKVYHYNYERGVRELKSGWTPNWARFCSWLKDRTFRMNKAMVAANAAKERREANDKVLRSYGLGKYQRKGDY